jgi:hypothetical protein
MRYPVQSVTVNLRRSVVIFLARVCGALDSVLYRPAVVRLIGGFKHSWRCQLARASILLDDRWNTDYWNDGPPVPSGRCEACNRRAAWLYCGGWALLTEDDPYFDELDAEDADNFMANRRVVLCGYCSLTDVFGDIRNEDDLQRALTEAGRRSTTWSWS